MANNQYELVKCNNGWGIQDNILSVIDNPIIILSDKNDALFIIQQLNNRNDRIAKLVNLIQKLEDENGQLRKQLDGICKSYSNYYGMNIRNAQWYGFKSDDLDD